MASEYSMFRQDISGLTGTYQDLTGNSTKNAYYTLASVQTIAEAMGDGFTAEDVTLTVDTACYGGTGSAGNNRDSYTILAGKTIPVLKNINKYGNMVVFFVLDGEGNTSTKGANTYLWANVINIQTGVLLGSAEMMVGWNTDLNFTNKLSLINATANRKMLLSERAFATINNGYESPIVFSNDCIVLCTPPSYQNANFYNVYTCYESGSEQTYYNHPITGYTRFSMLPVFTNNAANPKIIQGVYVLEHCDTINDCKNFSYSGVVYFQPCRPKYSNMNAYTPLLVISNE